MKNPPMMFAKQANLTKGPQQINNGRAPARESETFGPNRLLEDADGKRLDTTAPGGAVGSDPAMATVGTFDRTAHG